MNPRVPFFALITQLNADRDRLERLAERNFWAWSRIQLQPNDVLADDALAFSLQSAYCQLEDYFLRVSRFYGDVLPDVWQVALVEKMSWEALPHRPALLEVRWQEPAQTWLRFRDKVQNLHGEVVDRQKATAVQREVWPLLEAFPDIHEAFVSRLTALAETV